MDCKDIVDKIVNMIKAIRKVNSQKVKNKDVIKKLEVYENQKVDQIKNDKVIVIVCMVENIKVNNISNILLDI